VHYLWRNGVLGQGTNTDCGCGLPVAACPLWKEVLTTLDADPAAARAALADQDATLRTRHTRARLSESTARTPRPPRAAAAVERIVATYRAVAAADGARLVIDSSKYPAEAAALLGRADLDLRVLHLVRDPRACAHSWVTPKAYIPAMGVARSTSYWTAFNAASDLIGRAAPERYLRLRYEDFTAAPAATLRRVLDLVGLPDTPPVSADGTAVLGENHTVTGNPDRLQHGPVTIRTDEKWRTDLGRRRRAVATTLSAPLLLRYGYR
jgi:hypothetical protein